jgi:hypothetical protein
MLYEKKVPLENQMFTVIFFVLLLVQSDFIV